MLVSAMAKRHEAITDWIAPHLKDGRSYASQQETVLPLL